MSKKPLQVDGIVNELAGASGFFTPAASSPPPERIEAAPAIAEPVTVSRPLEEPKAAPAHPLPKHIPVHTRASTPASVLASTHINVPASPSAAEVVETIRKTVKQVGKEPLFIRMTPEEKRELTSIVYSFNDMYRDEGRKTSDNEAGRIAVNWMLEDYRQNGQNSILARVLAALNA